LINDKDEHPSKHPIPMDAIEFGSVIDDNDDHFLKTSYSNGCD
jgi:hypothetical protein